MSTININAIDCKFISSDKDKNTILAKSITETFFDVYECIIEDKTFIFEKIGEENNEPVVLCNIKKDNKEYVCEAILKTDSKEGIFLNESLLHPVVKQETIVTEKVEPRNEVLKEEKFENLNKANDVSDITNVIAESLSNYNAKKLNEKIQNYTSIYESRLKEFENKKKEFLNIIDREFEDRVKTFNNEIDSKLSDFFTINEKENKFLVFNETEKLRENICNISNEFKSSLENVKEFSKENISKVIEEKSKEIFTNISNYTDKLIEQNKDLIKENVNNLSNVFTEELNQLKSLKEDASIDNKLLEEQNKKFKSILEHVNSKFNQLNKKVKLISESKNDEYNELLAAVNNKEVIEYKTILKEKIEAAELNSVKAELKNELSATLQQEVRGMRRYAEMTSGGGGGGGSVGIQYGKGGTMDGDLTVTGEISANKIMAATVLSGATLDIGFELSGFNVTGNISANGGISGNNGYFHNEVSADTIASRNNSTASSTNVINGGMSVAGDFVSDAFKVTTGGGGISYNTTSFTVDSNGDTKVRDLNATRNVSTTGDLSASKITSTGFIGFETTQTGAGVTLKGDVDNGSGFFSSNFSDGSDGPRTGQFYQQGDDLFLNSVGGNDTHGDIQLATGDINNGPVQRVTIKGDTGRVGIGDTTPSEMLDVAGNITATGNLTATNITVTDDLSAGDIIKGKRLNIGTGNLFVDDGSSTGNAFVKIGAYGSGNFFGKEGSVNGAAYSLGVGTAGKIVEDMRVDTFALSGAGLVNKFSNPVILVASPGANKYVVPVSIQVYKSQSGGTRVSWGSGQAAISIGTFASSDTTGTFSQLTSLPRVVALIAGDWLYNRNQGPDTQTRIHSNRALAFRTSTNITSNSSDDVYYLKVRYMVMSEDGDFKSIGNLQIKDT